MGKRGVQHWKKRKAIAAYLFRRRGLGKSVTLSDVLIFSEQIAIEGIGNYVRFFTDSIGIQEDVVLTSGFTKDDLLGISESISKSLASNKEELISFSENFSSKFSTLNSESIELDEQLDLLFNLNPAADSVSFTEDFNKAIVKALSDGFFLDDSAAIDKDVYTDKSNALSFTEDFTYVIFRLLTQSLGPDYLNLTEDHRKSLIKPFYEELSFEELATLLVNLNKEETIGLSELTTFGISKGLDESLPLSEQVILLLGLNPSEQLTFTEYSNLTLLKRVVDGFALDDSAAIDKDVYTDKSNVVSLSEDFTYSIIRLLTQSLGPDYLNLTEEYSIALAKTMSEEFPLEDTSTLLFNLNKEENIGLSDLTSFTSLKNLAESVAILDQLKLIMKLNPSEQLTFTESKTLRLLKTIVDGFALDDSAAIDKDVYTDKSNVIVFTETIDKVIYRILDTLTVNDSLALGDLLKYRFSSSFLDSYSVSDSLLLGLSSPKAETLTFTDSSFYRVTKAVSDTFTLDDVSQLRDVDMNKSNTFGFEELLAFTTSISKTDSTALNDYAVYNVNKTVSDTFTLDDTSQFKDVDMNKSNVLGLEETFGFKLSKSFIDDLDINEFSGKQLGIAKTDDLVVSHNTGDVALSGNFSDRKLGGEPFNNITFN